MAGDGEGALADGLIIQHDQLIKDTLHAFFREFMELFYPQVAARLDFGRVTFLDKEAFTDLPEGSRREMDLVPGAGGLTRETYTESLFGDNILSLRYHAIGLPDLDAGEYVSGCNPLAYGLSALMRPRTMGRAPLKAQGVENILHSSVDEARKSLLLNLIETYLTLDDAEKDEFARLLSQPEREEVRQMITIYEQRGIEQGIVQGMQRALLELLRARFGELPERVVRKIEAVRTETELNALVGRAISANSLDELGLNEE